MCSVSCKCSQCCRSRFPPHTARDPAALCPRSKILAAANTFFLFFAVGTSGRPALKYELSSWILKFKACGPVNGQKSFLMISGSFDDCKKKEEVFIVLGLIF